MQPRACQWKSGSGKRLKCEKLNWKWVKAKKGDARASWRGASRVISLGRVACLQPVVLERLFQMKALVFRSSLRSNSQAFIRLAVTHLPRPVDKHTCVRPAVLSSCTHAHTDSRSLGWHSTSCQTLSPSIIAHYYLLLFTSFSQDVV